MIVVYGWAAVAVVMALLWWRQKRTRNATSVDAAWAIALGLLALAYAWRSEGEPARRALVAAIASVWAFRLAYYLVRYRVLREDDEDGRYRSMREHWGARAQPWFFLVYQLQAAVAALFSVFFLLAMRRPGPLDGWDYAGLAVALLALGGEALADRQLGEWRANNPGKTCRAGLWRYSRHPNYFFEWIHWWAYVLIGVGNWYLLFGPALMLLFLFRFTGIPYTEKQALRSRGDDYRQYQRTTSVFFPWFPKEEMR